MNILGLGLPELIVITLVLLLFFGAKRLPGLFRSIGESIGELKSGLQQPAAEQQSPEQTAPSANSQSTDGAPTSDSTNGTTNSNAR